MSDYRYTRHQVARSSRPDAVSGSKAYLIKNVSCLRLTYQIRLLTFMASERGSTLIIRLPAAAKLSGDLQRFVRDHRRTLKVEKAS